MSKKSDFARRSISASLTILFVLFNFAVSSVQAQTTVFTYQGRLNDASSAANGTYDLQFKLYNAAGVQIGAAQIKEDVAVSNGIFTVQLDAALFAANAFDGSERTLEIAVRRGAETGGFTVLTPRQPITSAPYAIRALNAGNADNAVNADTATTAIDAQRLGGTSASQFTRNDSQAFIRNQTTEQTGDFRINGTGAANVFNAETQYNIAGDRVLSNAGVNNLFAGLNAGLGNTGTDNSFVGRSAGVSNTTGSGNSFVGSFAGYVNTTGNDNSFVGAFAGISSTTGSDNSFFGRSSGDRNTTGRGNSFFGRNAALDNTTGNNNTVIGSFANVGFGNLTYATAIGANAVVSTNNTIALGRPNGADRVTAVGGIAMLGSDLRFRSRDDDHERIYYFVGYDGLRFETVGTFSWFNRNTNQDVMLLQRDGTLGIRGSYGQISDARYKTNVQTFGNALDAVRRLRGVTFNWKPEQNSNRNTQIGFIAQEVEQVLPEIVSTDQNGYKSVSYANAVPVLVEAVKEQQTQIEQQQKRLVEQQIIIDGLRKLACAQNPSADICK